jgi:hypothetical protein
MDADRHRVHVRALTHLARLALAPFERLGGVRRGVAAQQVGGVQLAQQADDVVLGRGFFAQAPVGQFPQLLHAALAVHGGDDKAGGGRKSVHLVRHRVLQQIPQLAAIAHPVQAGVLSQAGPHCGHTVPGV